MCMQTPDLVLGRQGCCNPSGASLQMLFLCSSSVCCLQGNSSEGGFDQSSTELSAKRRWLSSQPHGTLAVCIQKWDVANYRFSPTSHLTVSHSQSLFLPFASSCRSCCVAYLVIRTLGHVQGGKCDGTREHHPPSDGCLEQVPQSCLMISKQQTYVVLTTQP